jgi:hypothetical protein
LAVGITEGRRDGIKDGTAKGSDDGREVGIDDGRNVGIDEGRVLGDADGLVDGRADGRMDEPIIIFGAADGLEEGRFDGIEDGRNEGILLGFKDGRVDGILLGFKDGRVDGIVVGLEDGRDDGNLVGLEDGRDDGLVVGLDDGRDDGTALGLDDGRDDGSVLGRDEGRADGVVLGLRKEGRETGSSRTVGVFGCGLLLKRPKKVSPSTVVPSTEGVPVGEVSSWTVVPTEEGVPVGGGVGGRIVAAAASLSSAVACNGTVRLWRIFAISNVVSDKVLVDVSSSALVARNNQKGGPHRNSSSGTFLRIIICPVKQKRAKHKKYYSLFLPGRKWRMLLYPGRSVGIIIAQLFAGTITCTHCQKQRHGHNRGSGPSPSFIFGWGSSRAVEVGGGCCFQNTPRTLAEHLPYDNYSVSLVAWLMFYGSLSWCYGGAPTKE